MKAHEARSQILQVLMKIGRKLQAKHNRAAKRLANVREQSVLLDDNFSLQRVSDAELAALRDVHLTAGATATMDAVAEAITTIIDTWED